MCLAGIAAGGVKIRKTESGILVDQCLMMRDGPTELWVSAPGLWPQSWVGGMLPRVVTPH